MEKVAVYKNKDGITCVLIPASNVYVSLETGDFATIDGDISQLLVDREIPGYIVPATLAKKLLFGLITTEPEKPSYFVPAETIKAQYRRASLDEIASHALGDAEYTIIDRSILPTDRHFRNAWEMDGSVNMSAAKEIHKNNLREIRKPLLEKLDVDYLRASEAKDSAEMEAIVAKKTALRDITKHQEIASASTPEELKSAALGVLDV